jgi:hypothetical protein
MFLKLQLRMLYRLFILYQSVIEMGERNRRKIDCGTKAYVNIQEFGVYFS